jgi:hypothetical protein
MAEGCCDEKENGFSPAFFQHNAGSLIFGAAGGHPLVFAAIIAFQRVKLI